MEEFRKRLQEGLFKAIQAENEGYHFYMMAARSAEDSRAREMFTLLAEEEESHMRFLKKQYKAIIDTGSLDREIKLGAPRKLIGPSPIFTDSFKNRVGSAGFEMSALSIGIQLELNSIEFYRAEAEAAEDETVKGFYTELTEWESGHYQTLLKQHDSMKEEYWHSAGFAPF